MTQKVEFRVATVWHPHAPTKDHYSITRPRQTCTDNGSHIRSPQPNWRPSLVPFHQLWIYMVSKKHPGKADQSTLASGGSGHAQSFSVAISWGSKMNFSLCASMSGFCSNSHICYRYISAKSFEACLQWNRKYPSIPLKTYFNGF